MSHNNPSMEDEREKNEPGRSSYAKPYGSRQLSPELDSYFAEEEETSPEMEADDDLEDTDVAVSTHDITQTERHDESTVEDTDYSYDLASRSCTPAYPGAPHGVKEEPSDEELQADVVSTQSESTTEDPVTVPVQIDPLTEITTVPPLGQPEIPLPNEPGPEFKALEDSTSQDLKEICEAFKAFKSTAVRDLEEAIKSFKDKLEVAEKRHISLEDDLAQGNKKANHRITANTETIKSLEKMVHSYSQETLKSNNSSQEKIESLRERIKALEVVQRLETTANNPKQPPEELQSPVVAKRIRIGYRGYFWWVLRKSRASIEALRAAWVIALWNLIKEISNRVSSLASMSKSCQLWGGSYDRAGRVSNSISTTEFLISFLVLLYQLIHVIKDARKKHNEEK